MVLEKSATTKRNILFELDLLEKSEGETESVNWQSLSLELMGLFSDKTWFQSNGLANRERVFGHIEPIMARFLELQ